jgi:hypothetical protein
MEEMENSGIKTFRKCDFLGVVGMTNASHPPARAATNATSNKQEFENIM